MKIASSLALLLLLIGVCSGQTENEPAWKVDDVRVKDTPEHKAVKGFGALLIVIRDPQAFIRMWQRPEMPRFDSAKVVSFDEKIGIITLFAGCKPAENGVCDTEVDYRIDDPTGKIVVERKKQPLWKKQAPPAKNTHLGEAVLAITPNRKLPIGMYKVTAKVYDINSNVSFELETQFELR